MQVTMTMEEYEDLKYSIDKKIAEANEKHQTDLSYLINKYKIELDKLRDENKRLMTQNKPHVEQLNKMIEKYERMGANVDGCSFCTSESTLMDTADCNIIYINKDNDDRFYLTNSDSYTGNRKQINYCPMCGKKLGGE